MATHDEQDNIRVQPGPGRGVSDDRKGLSVGKRLTRKMARSGMRSASKRGGFRHNMRHTRGGFTASMGRKFPQRVVVKSHVVRHGTTGQLAGKLSAHVRYLARDGAGKDGNSAEFYTSDESGLDPSQFMELSVDDRHHFRVIISPENAAEIDDMNDYTRRVMSRIEKDLGTELDWIAVNHFNTDNPHSHVIIRGQDDQGNDLVIAPEYIKEGMRSRAQEVATELLRERSADDIQRSIMQEVDAERFTSLDNRLLKHADDAGIVDANSDAPVRSASFYRDAIAGRVQTLEKMGLATQLKGNTYQLKNTMKDDLRRLGRRNDIVKSLYGRHGEKAAAVRVFDANDSKPVVGRLVDRGLDNELTGRTYLLIQDAQENMHYVPDSRARTREELPLGSIVRAGAVDTQTNTNNNIATVAADNNGMYTRAAHLAHIDENQSYISKDERDGYVDAHETRLETLEKGGIVKRGRDGWAVPEDLPEQAQALADKMNEGQKKRLFTRLQVLSDTPINKQVQAQADTWLDGELLRRTRKGAQTIQYDRSTEQALTTRQRWLVEQGHARNTPSGVQYNRGFRSKLERAELSRHMAKAYGNRYDSAPKRGTIEGSYQGTRKLISGRYAVIERGGRVTAVKVGRAPSLELGQQISAQVGKAAKAALQAIRGRGIGD